MSSLNPPSFCYLRPNNVIFLPLDLASSFDFTPYTGDLYHCTLARLRAADLDQEVKERAIACMGQIISHLGDHLQVRKRWCCVVLSPLLSLRLSVSACFSVCLPGCSFLSVNLCSFLFVSVCVSVSLPNCLCVYLVCHTIFVL